MTAFSYITWNITSTRHVIYGSTQHVSPKFENTCDQYRKGRTHTIQKTWDERLPENVPLLRFRYALAVIRKDDELLGTAN